MATRESRFFPPPFEKKDEPELLKVDTAILKALALDPYLDRHWLAALVDRNADAIRTHLHNLIKAGYIKVADSQTLNDRALNRALKEKLCYELAGRGMTYLKTVHGVYVEEKTTKILEHQAMASQVSAGFKIGAKGNMRYVPFSEILSRPETPAALLNNEKPFTIKKLHYRYRKEHFTKDVRPDLPLAGLERTDGDDAHEYFLVGGEADNNNEPGQSSVQARSSLERHFWEYIAIADQRLYEKLYGFPNMSVPFVFSDRTQMRLAIRTLEGIDAKMYLKKIFLFKEHSQIPSGEMVTGEWLRLTGKGVEPFYFTKKGAA